MLKKDHVGLNKSPNMEERLKRSDKINFSGLRFERSQIVGLRKARRRQDAPKIVCARDE